MGDSILCKSCLTARLEWRQHTSTSLNDLLETKNNEEASSRYCGARRTRRACARSRSRCPPLHQGAPDAAPIYNWTGFYIGGHVGGAFSSDNSFNGLVPAATMTPASSAACRSAPTSSSPANWVLGVEGQYSWLGGNNNGCAVPDRLRLHQRPAWHRLGHRPHRLHLGSGAALREGRLCLFRQPARPCSLGGVPGRLRASTSNHKDGYTVGAGLEYMFTPELVGQGRVPVLRLRQQPAS